MTVLTEDRRTAAHYIVSEASSIYRSREQVMITGSAPLLAGTVLGQIAAASADVQAAADAGNAANTGALTLANPAFGTDVREGIYNIVCFAAAANGGKFRVEDPELNEVGTATVGVAFTKQIKFTIADGAQDFVVGEKFTVSVEATRGAYAALDLTATNGLKKASAILYEGCDPTLGDARRTITARETEVKESALIWPAGINATQKQNALDQLAACGIVGR
ncbi:head decoration protein [Mesorhizobium loti]|uniref:head decoration protein n=1 Tax=Rhizobium loti TaxID=381 RepID=UPI000420E7FC|nr:head decoration protein [Mesorhizobium loti]